jgi:dTDP-4-amino-4,6-dideoxygalactose transaminase
MIRHQLPVYSPLPLRAILGALGSGAAGGEDPRAVLAELLGEERGAHSVVLCRSGTQALQVALRAAVDAVGGDVALPAYSCFDVATAAVAAQVTVRFYDIEPGTLGPDLGSLEAALVAGARVIVAGPLYGIPLDWAPVQDMTRRYGALLVEDAAQGHGSRTAGGEAGTVADLSVLSFGRGKGWTGGEGGALVVRNPESEAGTARTVGPEGGDRGEVVMLLKTLVQWALGRPSLYGLPSAMPWLGLGETHYREPTDAVPMGRRAAALALGTREVSTAEASLRGHAARSLVHDLEVAGLIPDPVGTIAPPPGGVAGYLRLPVLLSRGTGGFPSIRRAKALGIARGYPTPLSALEPLRPFWADAPTPCPGAQLLVQSLVTLPTHSRVARDDRARIVQAMASYGG